MSFLGGFEGTVGLTHLPEGEYSTEHYNPRKKLKARLLWVNVSSKAIGLSLQKQIVAGEAFKLADVEIGDIFHGEDRQATCRAALEMSVAFHFSTNRILVY